MSTMKPWQVLERTTEWASRLKTMEQKKKRTKEHHKGKVRVNAPIKIPIEYTTFQGKVPSLVYKVFHDIYLNMFTSHAISLRTSFTDECFAGQ